MCLRFTAWMLVNKGKLAFSCVIAAALFPATQQGYDACMLTLLNFALLTAADNSEAGMTFPPSRWFAMQANEQRALLLVWLKAWLNATKGHSISSYTYWQRWGFVEGLLVFPGRWLKDIKGPEEFVIYVTSGSDLEGMRLDDIKGMRSVLQKWHGYKGDAGLEWRCSRCDGHFFKSLRAFTDPNTPCSQCCKKEAYASKGLAVAGHK